MEINDYYKSYYTNGGQYTMEAGAAPTSRVSQILTWLKLVTKPGDRILDVGCGDGYLSTQLPDRDWQGIDINVEKAKCKAKVQDLMKEPWDLEPGFDAVVCSEVAEHVWDMRVLHREAFRLLKPEGYYILSTPNFNWMDNVLCHWVHVIFDPKRPWTMEHIRHYTIPVHLEHLKGAGFSVADYTGLDAHYGEFFRIARANLKVALTIQDQVERYKDDAQVDILLGRMFPECSHTIGFLAKKGV